MVFIWLNSPRFVMKTVVLTTLAKLSPWSARTILMLSRTRSVWASMPPVTKAPLAGSRGICPLANRKSPIRTATLYGPTALGAAAGEMACGRILRMILRVEGPKRKHIEQVAYQRVGLFAAEQPARSRNGLT